MAEQIIKLPDVGEGVAEAELVEWNVKVGDLVREDAVLAAVMTDKATVEIPSPVDGKIVWLGAEVGETVAVGTAIIRIEVAGEGSAPDPGEAPAPEAAAQDEPHGSDALPAPPVVDPAPSSSPASTAKPARTAARSATAGLPRAEGERPLASPSVRLRAKEAGIDLRQVAGTGPAGPAPPHRRKDVAGEVANPAHHLYRGGRRYRA